MSRREYMVDLRAQIALITEGHSQVTLAGLHRDLEPTMGENMPGRVTLAKAVTGLGWVRLRRPGSGAVFKAPGK